MTTTNATRADTLVRALQAAVARDHDAIAALCTDDVTAWTPVLSASSAPELLASLELRDDAFSELELEATPLDTGGDFAVVEWSLGMTHTGTLTLPDGDVLEPTGLRVTVHGATVAEFRDDLICAVRQYWDELAMFEQLGLLGEPALAD
jgi:ketosteroid isomerase-like protein